jgi:hypothetical protein
MNYFHININETEKCTDTYDNIHAIHYEAQKMTSTYLTSSTYLSIQS